MKEIKFRAWDKKRSRWAYFEIPSAIFASWDRDNFKYENYENWCEYTGLKDKNGREIYEGDIVNWTHGTRGKKSSFGEGVSQVAYNQEECSFEEWEKDKMNGYTIGSIECEIIGNIYENPELLTK